MVAKNIDVNIRIAENIKKRINKKFKTTKEASIAGGWGEKYLTNTISKIKNSELYPSVPQLIEIANLCGCDIKEFFK